MSTSTTWTVAQKNDAAGPHPVAYLKRSEAAKWLQVAIEFETTSEVPSNAPRALEDAIKNLLARVGGNEAITTYERVSADFTELGRSLAIARAHLARLQAERQGVEAEMPKGAAARLLDLDSRLRAMHEEVATTERQHKLTAQLLAVARNKARSLAEREAGRAKIDILAGLREDRRVILDRLAAAAEKHLTQLASVAQAIGSLHELPTDSLASMLLNRLAEQAVGSTGDDDDSPFDTDDDELDDTDPAQAEPDLLAV